MKRIGLLFLLVVFASGSVWGATINVPADHATIQAAIDGDTVLLARAQQTKKINDLIEELGEGLPGDNNAATKALIQIGAKVIPYQAQLLLGNSAVGQQEVYIVQRGDTLGKISQDQFQDAGLWIQLAKYNKISNPNLIKTKQRIVIPSQAQLLLGNSAVGQQEVYIVQRGDTLGKISQDQFQDAGLWAQLAKYNKISNPNLIKTKQRIVIPSQAQLVLNTKQSDYDEIRSFGQVISNFSITVLDGKQGLIDQNGTIVLEPDYDEIGSFKAIEK